MSSETDSTFSLRRLNPFNGNLQVFATGNARALSSNGINWEIQVLSDRPQGLWANTPFAGRQFYRFGLWSRQAGLTRIPLHPLFNTQQMLAAAGGLVQRLQPRLEQLPFAPADRHELWLLDEESGIPIALLNSAVDASDLTARDVRRWIAAERGDFGFRSTQLEQRGLPMHDGHNPRVHASVLEAQVRGRGGQSYRRGWFLRDQSGNAKALSTGHTDLPAEAFPTLPLTLEWEHEEERQLVMDYIVWKAPQLLLLPNLPQETRRQLEELAVQNALQIDRLWRLYPEIHNKALLNTARIEARIRAANPT